MILRQDDKNTILEKNQENGLDRLGRTKVPEGLGLRDNTQRLTGIKNYLCSTDVCIYKSATLNSEFPERYKSLTHIPKLFL